VTSAAFIVNTGEPLRTWNGDRFVSVKHVANPDYRITCIPSCFGPGNPAKYPPISYNQSQAVVQGE